MNEYEKIIAQVIENNIEQIWTSISDYVSDRYKQRQVDCKKAFNIYLTNAVKKYSKTKTLFNKTDPMNILEYYVPVDISLNGDIINTSKISNIFELSKFILITGIGGSGKSTLMRYLFLKAIKEGVSIPIFIELKDLNNDNEGILLDCVYNSLSRFGFRLEYDYFLYALESGCFLFLFDAFDELQKDKRLRVEKELNELCDQYPNNNYIVSSRKNEAFIGWSEYIETNIEPLSKERALLLISKIKYDSEKKNKFSEELSEHLYDQHNSFASNPLLLTIMLMTYDQYSNIPDKIYLFYEQAFETLYHHHDSIKGEFTREMNTNLASDDFKKILSCFSAITYIEDKLGFTRQQLIDYFSEVKQVVDINFNVDDYIKDLTEAVCIFVVDGFYFQYSHRSFQEYFAAQYMVSIGEDSAELLKQLLMTKSLRLMDESIFPMLFEMNKNMFEKNLIIPVLIEIKNNLFKKTGIELYLAYLKDMYRDGGAVSNYKGKHEFFRYINSDTYYFPFIGFLKRHYPEYFKKCHLEKNEKYTREYIELIENHGRQTGSYKVIDFEKVIELDFTNQLLFVYREDIANINNIYRLLDDLTMQHKKRNNLRDLIFKVKSIQ